MGRCLRAILNTTRWNELVIVDGNSTDNTQKIVKKLIDELENAHLVYDKGQGIGIARNIGVNHATGDILCFIDADDLVEEKYFTRVRNFFKTHQEHGILGFQSILHGFLSNIQKKLPWEQQKADMDAKTVTGAFMAFRRKVFKDVGGFWDFPPFGKDENDFCLRAKQHGWKIAILPSNNIKLSRDNLRSFLQKQFTLGKAEACLQKKYSHSFSLHQFLVSGKIDQALYKLTNNFFLMTPLSYLMLSPFKAIFYSLKKKDPRIFFFRITTRYVKLLGFICGYFTWARKMQEFHKTQA